MRVLWNHHKECKNQVLAEWQDGGDRSFFVMAPGTGKTVTIAHILRELMLQDSNSRALFLCHQNDILKQAKTTFEAEGVPGTQGFYHGSEKTKEPKRLKCLFASFMTLAGRR